MGKLDWLRRPIAHRGLHDAARGIIENTPSAVSAAIEHGYAFEMDVQPAADMTPMVFHDTTLERLTSGEGAVNTLPPVALKAVAFKDSQDHMQSLDELLDMVGGRVPMVIDIKHGRADPHEFAKAVAERLSGYDGLVAVMSFDPRIIAAFIHLAPDIPRGLIATGTFLKSLKLTRWERFQVRHIFTARIAKPHFIAYDIRHLPAIAPFVARTVYGLPLLTWTVRSDAEQRRAARWTDAMIFEGFTP